MHDLVAGKLHDLPLEIRHDLGLVRHEVFVRRLGWSLPDIQGAAAVEWDRFDGENTVQIVALDSRRRVCGCARLIPTTGQYLLQDLLPRSLNIDLPCSPTVWELSRFAASVISDDSPSSISGMRLFPHAMAIAASLGATRIVGAVTRAIARLYRRFGLELRQIEPVGERHALPFMVCAIDLSALAFAHLGHDPDNLLNAITWYGPRPSTAISDMSVDVPRLRLFDGLPASPCDSGIGTEKGGQQTCGDCTPITGITPRRSCGDDAGCRRPSPNPA
ncbi:MAG: GNAT family N-acetyltransferase [Pandoraea sp.]|uniref:acyl-homoserine-lactone synthase n=1 Tax=Pandoraea sp. TaxID=1883445 RepID=UPI00120AFC02|nr:acyl-homoserine-lactone synthase [Pandoraea sp.]TAM18572.1 MAG: GNAT family N-acetyltransferase [Pandoraea sp.]